MLPNNAPKTINGFCEPRFSAVEQAFRNNFSEHGDIGAACTIYHGDQCIVDLWGGFGNPESSIPWRHDTLQLVFSAAKGITTTCIWMLVERGLLDIDKPIADYWPEFGCNGKEAISTRMVLSHRAGLAAVDGDLTLAQVFQWQPVIDAIQDQAPNWSPNTTHGYHARSFGWILGELLRRISNTSIGEFIQSEIAIPQQLDLWIGLPDSELGRCAKVIPPQTGTQSLADLFGESSLMVRVLNGPSNLFDYNDMWNQAELLKAQMPSSNAVCTAPSLAQFYKLLLPRDGRKSLLSVATINEACKLMSDGPDEVIKAPTRFGSGFALPPFLAPHCSASSFGHSGAGGSLGFADPEADISFAYVMNKMRFDMGGDPRTEALLKALYSSL